MRTGRLLRGSLCSHLRVTVQSAHERRDRQHSIGRPAFAWRGRYARGSAAQGTARGVPGAARLRRQQRLGRRAAADTGAERIRLCDAALRHARLRQERRRVRPGDLPRTSRGPRQRSQLSCRACRGRPGSHRRDRLELRRRGRSLCRRHQSARCRGHFQRRLGAWRAQVSRPASDAGSLGEIHRHAGGGAGAIVPARGNR